MAAERSEENPEPAPGLDLAVVLHSRGYLLLLLVAALLGVPISLIAFGFLAVVHELEHLVWDTVPTGLGFTGVPAWWPIILLGLAGLLVGIVVKYLPGSGGHVPADGLAADAAPPGVVPGVVLAAGSGLVLGAVLGPEAPLIAVGSGLALLGVKRLAAARNANASAMIASAGSAAAISAIFGNPLVAAVIFLEVAGLARRKAMLVLLPCLVSSGVGALVFVGLGKWTGLGIGALAIPTLEAADLVATDLVSALPVAAIVAVGTWAVFMLGRRTAKVVQSRTVVTTTGVGLLAGSLAAIYAVLTGHSPAEVALSGQAALGELALHPEQWSAGALVLLLLCKGIAYALCLGAFRGGPVFPALFLGAACGVLATQVVPGIGTVSGLAIGMAAGAAASTGLPITSILLVVLLLGPVATSVMPVIILAAVSALVVDEMLTHRLPEPATSVEVPTAHGHQP